MKRHINPGGQVSPNMAEILSAMAEMEETKFRESCHENTQLETLKPIYT